MPRRSSFAPDERVVFAFATNGGMDGRGEPNKARIWDFWVEVVGHALLEFVVYGHYVESRSPELDDTVDARSRSTRLRDEMLVLRRVERSASARTHGSSRVPETSS